MAVFPGSSLVVLAQIAGTVLLVIGVVYVVTAVMTRTTAGVRVGPQTVAATLWATSDPRPAQDTSTGAPVASAAARSWAKAASTTVAPPFTPSSMKGRPSRVEGRL